MAENPYARSLALVTAPSYSYLQSTQTAPPSQPTKPSVWQAYRELLAPSPTPEQTPMQSAMVGLRHNAEGAAIGTLMGFLEAKLGSLDLGGKYPVDGIAALLLYLLSIRDAGKPDGFASDVRAVSQSLTTIAFYRKVKEASSGEKTDAKGDMSGHTATSKNKDPIAALAEKFGLKEKAA